MTDYRVVHMPVAVDDDRSDASARLERECDNAAREGWYLFSVVADVRGGTTSGMWLFFATADEAHDDVAAVAVATEILTHAADEGSQTGA